MENWTAATPYVGVMGLVVAYLIYAFIKKSDQGSTEMVEIADAIHEGAMTFLKREYSILFVFVVILFAVLFVAVDQRTAVAFLAGAACSIAAGLSGMKAATRANVRTTQAANSSGQGPALSMAFSGGAVMGLAVASLGLLGIGALTSFYGVWENAGNASAISGFAMGASTIALFARVGRRDLYQSGRCRGRSRRQSRAGHSRGRSPKSGRHRGQCRGQCRGCRRDGRRHLRVIRRFGDRNNSHCSDCVRGNPGNPGSRY